MKSPINPYHKYQNLAIFQEVVSNQWMNTDSWNKKKTNNLVKGFGLPEYAVEFLGYCPNKIITLDIETFCGIETKNKNSCYISRKTIISLFIVISVVEYSNFKSQITQRIETANRFLDKKA